MLVNHRFRFLFVHIPKTSGAAFREYNQKRLSTWWRRNWEEVGQAHQALTAEVAEQYRDYLKFTIVRNPWQMIASAYRFETQGIRHDKAGRLRQRDISITDWLDERSQHDECGPFPRQLQYISDEGRVLVDRFVKQEDLGKEIKPILEALKAPYREQDWQSPKRHFYGSYNWRDYFKDPAAKAKVIELCAKDFDFFGWSPNFDTYL